MSLINEATKTIDKKLSQIHQEILKQQEKIEKVAELLSDIEESQYNDEILNDNKRTVIRKLGKLLDHFIAFYDS